MANSARTSPHFGAAADQQVTRWAERAARHERCPQAGATLESSSVDPVQGGRGQLGQAEVAELDRVDSRPQARCGEAGHQLGAHDLVAVRRVEDAGGSVDGCPRPDTVAVLRLAHVESDTALDSVAVRQALDGVLDRHRRGHRIGSGGEGRAENRDVAFVIVVALAVAVVAVVVVVMVVVAFERCAAVVADGVVDQPLVVGHDRRRSIGLGRR